MSLKLKAKERLFWAIRQVVLPFGRIILLVDHRTIRIVSACCSISELIDEGVDLVELISKRRQPMKNKVALYLLSDDFASINYLIEDFSAGHELYKSAFIMFNCHLSDDRALRKIAEHVDVERILACVELHLNFVAYEDRVFHGNMGFTLLSLYPTHSGKIVYSIASSLASLCSTLGASPQIRYHNCPSGLPQLVANSTEALIKDTAVDDTRKTDDILLVVDRSFDAVPLHIHEYTYQAFVYDVMRIPCCTDPLAQRSDDVWEFEYVANSGKREKREALLSCEKDVLWQRFRHMHIQKVNELVSEEVEKFAGHAAVGAHHQANTTRDILHAVRELPKTQYMVEKYWAHVALTERSFEQIENIHLVKIGELEQSLATNADRSGNKLSRTKALQQLKTLLGDVEITCEVKMRLIFLYVAVYRNVNETHINELIDIASLSMNDVNIVHHFVELGLGPAAVEHVGSASPRSAALSGKITHKNNEKGDAYVYYKKHAEGGEYELSRFMPEIRHIIGRILAGTLDEQRFPSLSTASSQTPLRGRTPIKPKGRVIIYVLGGITFSEMRIMYDMASRTGADVYLGGDSIIVPSGLIEDMRHAFSAVEKT
ncbi:Protein transport protein sec1 [Babesia sp. Xinjiang]|uniref:Protein transport protein sec1 n=1 Tax=Babesia sp. Xinjiang TaxID=462227 RepID=UPI000A222FBA|nr:Protein transport protein sec1 [Babesia sp. Xinjiang]ORM40593.1 Protein transport protein sec1 [Babesia sp. Xinjiang]